MAWLDASDYFAMDVAARDRVDALRSMRGREGPEEGTLERTTCRSSAVSKGAVMLGLVALAACAGCATGTRAVVVEPDASGAAAGQASPPAAGDEIPGCGGSTYNRATGLCVSEGA